MSDRDILNVAEVAEYLQVSTKWVYEAVGLQRVPHFKVGNRIRFRRDDLAVWIQEQSK